MRRPDNDLELADWQNGPQPRPSDPRGRELSYAETFATLDDVMARLRAKYPDQFQTKADDPAGLAERRMSQR